MKMFKIKRNVCGKIGTHVLFRTFDNRRNLLVTYSFISHLKDMLFCCDSKLRFEINSAKLTFIRAFVDHSNNRYNSIP